MTKQHKVLVTRQFPPAVMKRLQDSFEIIRNEDDHHMAADEILSLASDVSAIMCDPTNIFDAKLISKLPESIGLITTFSVGYDHLDAQAAREKGILLGNTPDVLTDATADIALLCMLGAARQATSAAKTLRDGKWGRWSSTEFLGVHMSGKSLGILGMGRIGQAVARRARGFDMNIHYHNRRPVTAEGLEEATYHETLEQMLKHCQFLSINCPLTPETHHLIDEARINLLPDNAVIVNTARGPVVDDSALIDALKSGKVAAAGLDVFENEPNLDPRYLELDNVFLLPHIGSATFETRDAMGFKCCDNLDAFFSGKPLPNPISI
ncbi:2-hydroxyacid dehydrogenase [Sneathiella glossodoripedis]|uniref:2-hydroxyacid dehydrogenase n=1 Tax=Sneathiella glossodoripedis TaxID=418853 RepID=UPI000471DE5D|nr:D-glycerate dehydrogenase [Sneathiella glossodoripedis]